MRIYSRMQAAGTLTGPLLDRYLNLLLEHDPQALVAQRSDRAVQIAIMAGNQSVAMQALRARAAAQPPVWLSSYSALTGVYFDDRAPAVNQAFLASLHPQNIGQRLASKPDENRSLVGSVWFYYSARFGEFLAHTGAPGANDYLPSSLETQPGNPDAYIALGEFDAAAKLLPDAIGEFREALDLDADRGEAYDGIARVLMQQGRRPDAIAEWRESIAAFQREQDRGVRVRETFWAHVSAAIQAISDAKVFADLQPDIHRLLADYVHINGGYRLEGIMGAVLEASYRSNAGYDWLLDISSQTDGMWTYQFDQSDDEQEWLARFRLADAMRRATRRQVYFTVGPRIELIDVLLAQGKESEALAEWRQFTPEERNTSWFSLAQVDMRLAGASGTLDRLIARYKAEPAKAPDMQQVLFASQALRQDGHVPAALALLEFAYTRELDRQHLEIANFLGLAKVYLERGNQLDQALAILRRMTLVAGEPFEAFEPAGDLLTEFHRDAEAREFYAKAVQATPWNASAKVKLASRAGLMQVVADSTAPYSLRADAARKLAPSQVPVTGELALLASGDKIRGAGFRPALFFVEARLQAAANTSDPTLKLSLLREALAIAPDDGRVRTAAIRAAIAAHNNPLALAMYQSSQRPQVYFPQPEQQQPEPNKDLLEALAGAAERTGDLAAAQNFLGEAGGADSKRQIAVLKARQKRRDENAKLQPVVTERLEQPQIVRPRIVP
jgi:tetratricopeptide (TPR) repeat protein